MGKTETVQGKRNERNIYLKDKEDERLQSYEGEDKRAELNHDKNSLSIYELELKKTKTNSWYLYEAHSVRAEEMRHTNRTDNEIQDPV